MLKRGLCVLSSNLYSWYFHFIDIGYFCTVCDTLLQIQILLQELLVDAKKSAHDVKVSFTVGKKMTLSYGTAFRVTVIKRCLVGPATLGPGLNRKTTSWDSTSPQGIVFLIYLY